MRLRHPSRGQGNKQAYVEIGHDGVGEAVVGTARFYFSGALTLCGGVVGGVSVGGVWEEGCGG